MNIKTGNLEDMQDKRGWFIGHFAEGIFHNKDFEVKWGVHKKGPCKVEAAANRTAKSISILISGKFKTHFPQLGKDTILEKQGDYIYWAQGIQHSSEALEDTVLITIRWPSVPNDQYSE